MGKEQIRAIAATRIEQLPHRLRDQQMDLNITDAVLDGQFVRLLKYPE